MLIMKEHDSIFNSDERRPLQNLSVVFARKVRRFCIDIGQHHNFVDKSAIIQMYRCATSVGANIREAQFAESDRDFLHKLKISEKEHGEFLYWLGLLTSDPPISTDERLAEIDDLALQLRKLLRSVILASKKT